MKKWSPVSALFLLAACATANVPPQVESFTATGSANRVTFSWKLSDANGDALRCALDANGDGTPEFSDLDCSKQSSQVYTYPGSGTFTAKLSVSDGKGGSVGESKSVVIGSSLQPVPNPSPPAPTPQPNPNPTPPSPPPASPPPTNPPPVNPPPTPPSPPPVTPPPPAPPPVTPPPPNPGSSGYNITVLFDSTVAEKYKQTFRDAAARWEKIITGDLPDIAGPIDTASLCSEVKVPGSIASLDDVVILVGTFTQAPSGLLGYAGPCSIRRSNGLTSVGQMKFDTADLDPLMNAGLLNATITHEMGHVLGIGVLWDNKNLVKYAGDADKNGCDDNPQYVGVHGRAEWAALGQSGDAPVENAYGPGSCEGHWREAVFKKELMTSYLNGGTNPLSRLTIASLEDLGYTVNYAGAEIFALADPAGVQAQGITPHQHSILLPPTSITNDTP